MSVNKVILLGHTGKAPDFKEFDHETRFYDKGRATNPGAYRVAQHCIAKRIGKGSQSVR